MRAYPCPCSQTLHHRHECTVHQSTQLIRPRQGDRRPLFRTCILALQQRWLRPPNTEANPPKRDGDHFRHQVVSSSRARTSARQTDRHSIPIALGPAQFNGLYLKGSGRPLRRVPWHPSAGALQIQCSSLSPVIVQPTRSAISGSRVSLSKPVRISAEGDTMPEIKHDEPAIVHRPLPHHR